MRYLYGDSAAFPLQYNFLATLEVFVAQAARAAGLDAEVRAVQEATAEAGVARAKSVNALEIFHNAIVHAVRGSSTNLTDPQVLDYARQVVEDASRIVDEVKRGSVAVSEREQAAARIEIDRKKIEVRKAVEAFLTAGRIPILESRVSMRLVDGANELSAVFTHPEGITTSFTLSTAGLPQWAAPRKVGEFASGLDLMVGKKKSLFKRTTQPEAVHLDEYIVSGFDLSDDTAEIKLRRKVTDPAESFVFQLQRTDEELLAVVDHPGDNDGDAPGALDPADRAHLERLWQLLRAGVADALGHKERLVSAELDGKDLFDQAGPVSLIERVVKMIAPTVLEVSRRSPNPQELSLKVENDGGRREEIYLKKEELLSKLEPLGERERLLFAPLALTRERSPASLVPPPVAPSERPT
jgi:hypothetical protein